MRGQSPGYSPRVARQPDDSGGPTEIRKDLQPFRRIILHTHHRTGDHEADSVRDNCNQRCSELPFSFIKLFKSIVIVSISDDVVDNTSVRSQSHVRMPLNSSRITAGQLRRL